MEAMTPVFINLHAKCPIFSAKDGKDTESHTLKVMTRFVYKAFKMILLDFKCDAHLGYESILLVSND